MLPTHKKWCVHSLRRQYWLEHCCKLVLEPPLNLPPKRWRAEKDSTYDWHYSCSVSRCSLLQITVLKSSIAWLLVLCMKQSKRFLVLAWLSYDSFHLRAAYLVSVSRYHWKQVRSTMINMILCAFSFFILKKWNTYGRSTLIFVKSSLRFNDHLWSDLTFTSRRQ
jgi:hypothetical protein